MEHLINYIAKHPQFDFYEKKENAANQNCTNQKRRKKRMTKDFKEWDAKEDEKIRNYIVTCSFVVV